MNDLSILLYLAGVSGNLGSFLALASIGAGASLLLSFIFYKSRDYPCQGVAEGEFAPWNKALLVLCLCIGLVSNLVPSKETVYMIAASEIGEATLLSDESKELYGDLKKVIKGYIPEE